MNLYHTHPLLCLPLLISLRPSANVILLSRLLLMTFMKSMSSIKATIPNIVSLLFMIMLIAVSGAEPNAELELVKDGNVVWSGRADENGKAAFNIKFTDETYDERWLLRDASGNQREISFFSDTPVKLKGMWFVEELLEGPPEDPTLRFLIPVVVAFIIFIIIVFLFFRMRR